ncbi:coiled-coil domain-containing protein 63-like [Ranitomeya imitator]|uniref:coiled-coil domain-containing protein 63-like n=1 Tax=Ranitomeya imitator TaxID=111125 RepID=UPI0037E73745
MSREKAHGLAMEPGQHSKMQIEKKPDWHLPSLGKNEDAKPTEMDLKKLEQQYRVAEIMKASFRKQTEHLLLSQQTNINVLKEQQKAMELAKLCRGSQKCILKDKENAKNLCELAEAQDQYNRLVEEQKKLISDLNMKIKEKEEEIVQQKNAISNAKISQGRIAHLENELQHVTQNFNVIKTENENLKENINHLRFKKTKYQNLIDKMHQKITHQKALTEKMQERITSMHNEKSDIQTEVLTVKDVAEKEFKKYDIKIEELSRYLDHLNKQQQFNETKLFDFFTKERELQKKRQEKRLKEMKKHNQGIIDNYNSICERLKQIYGQQDVDLDKMAKQYMLNNMKIYSLFTYVNKVNNELEDIVQDIKSSEDEILHLESCNKNLLNEQLVRQKELEEKLQNISETTDKYKFKCRDMSTELLLITSAAEDLVKNLGCDTSPMKKKLGFEKSTCQEKLQYFKILETEMDKLMQIHSYSALGAAAQGSLSSATISATLVTSNVSCIVGLKKISLPSMPKTIKATDDTVLGFNELREKVLNHAIFREKTKRQTHSLKYMTSGNIKRRSNK